MNKTNCVLYKCKRKYLHSIALFLVVLYFLRRNQLSPNHDFGDAQTLSHPHPHSYAGSDQNRPKPGHGFCRISSALGNARKRTQQTSARAKDTQPTFAHMTSVASAHKDTIRFMQIKFNRITALRKHNEVLITWTLIYCIYRILRSRIQRRSAQKPFAPHQQYHNILLCLECIGTRCDHCVTSSHSKAEFALMLRIVKSLRQHGCMGMCVRDWFHWLMIALAT